MLFPTDYAIKMMEAYCGAAALKKTGVSKDTPAVLPCAPRVGSDYGDRDAAVGYVTFQSTLPAWGATRCTGQGHWQTHYFNPRSPCGERPAGLPLAHASGEISIHAPRVGSDARTGATGEVPTIISIHAPRGGSDILERSRHRRLQDFNPRSPCGERRVHSISRPRYEHFNPRSPWGERRPRPWPPQADILFQSTLPVWGATISGIYGSAGSNISIHAPRVGSDGLQIGKHTVLLISIHAPRVGSDQAVEEI